jgi:hypothetical protein
MDDRVNTAIQQRHKHVEDRAVRYREGEITATSPLTITVGGVPLPNVKTLAGWTPAVGNKVAVLTWGNDLIVLPGAIV